MRFRSRPGGRIVDGAPPIANASKRDGVPYVSPSRAEPESVAQGRMPESRSPPASCCHDEPSVAPTDPAASAAIPNPERPRVRLQ